MVLWFHSGTLGSSPEISIPMQVLIMSTQNAGLRIEKLLFKTISSLINLFPILILVIISFQTTSSPDSQSSNFFTDSTLQDIAYLDYLLDLKISSGSFLELKLEKTPSSITVISNEMIKLSGAKNMSELLEIFVPGFQYMYNKWNGTIWGLRGVANDRNTKIIYLVNGHKLNTQARDGFQGETVLGLMDDIERVEVLRGPAGLVYGSGAIAGIINVVTRKAQQNQIQGSLTYGSNNSQAFQANVYSFKENSHKLSFSLGYRKSDGFSTHQSRIYGRGQWPYPVWLDLKTSDKDGVPSDGNFGSTDGNWKIAASYDIGQFNLYARVTRQKENAGGLFIIDPWPELKDKSPSDSTCGTSSVDGKVVRFNDPFWAQAGESNGANLHQYISDNIMVEAGYTVPFEINEITAKISFDGNTTRVGSEKRDRYLYESEYYENVNNSGDKVRYWDVLQPSKNPDFIEETFGEKRFSFNSTYHLKSISKLQLAAGLEYRLDIMGNDLTGRNENFENTSHPVISDINYNTFSLFSEGFYDFSEKIGLHLGGRLDFHTRAFMADPKIALILRPNESHSIKLMYQTSSNNGSTDNYEYNKNHYDDNGNIKTDLSFSKPYSRPDANSTIISIPQLETLHRLKPEKTRSAEVTSFHKLGNDLSILPSFAFGKVSDLFVWSQDFFRVINVGKYCYVNAEVEARFDSKYIKAGASHSFQRPVLTEIEEQKGYLIRQKLVSFDSAFDVDAGKMKYISITSDSTFDTIPINIVKDAITYDGKNFLNLSTNITKFYFTVFPAKWIAFHTNLRLFWGLPGRDPLYEKDTGFNYWNISDSREEMGLKEYLIKSVSKKLNLSLHFFLPNDLELSFFAYDVLGIDQPFNQKYNAYVINTLRWQHMAVPEQKELYSTDQRTFGFKISKSF